MVQPSKCYMKVWVRANPWPEVAGLAGLQGSLFPVCSFTCMAEGHSLLREPKNSSSFSNLAALNRNQIQTLTLTKQFKRTTTTTKNPLAMRIRKFTGTRSKRGSLSQGGIPEGPWVLPLPLLLLLPMMLPPPPSSSSSFRNKQLIYLSYSL